MPNPARRLDAESEDVHGRARAYVAVCQCSASLVDSVSESRRRLRLSKCATVYHARHGASVHGPITVMARRARARDHNERCPSQAHARLDSAMMVVREALRLATGKLHCNAYSSVPGQPGCV